jgi:hypothetical protein
MHTIIWLVMRGLCSKQPPSTGNNRW